MNIKIGLLLFFVLNCCSCQISPKKPDLKRIYQVTSTQRANEAPVILIPGIMGSQLRKRTSNEEVWPGPLIKSAFSSYEELSLTIDPNSLEPQVDDLQSFDIFSDYLGTDYYGLLQETLNEIASYDHPISQGGKLGSRRRLYIFHYDWRQDLVHTAGKLDQFIKDIQQEYQNEKLKVDIIAHSMGGLLARYYLMYGPQDVLAEKNPKPSYLGAKNVSKTILLGTPNWGSVKGLQTMLMGFDVGFGSVSPLTLASFPSIYQLLPNPRRDWMIDPQGDKIERDLFDIETWKDYQWSIFSPSTKTELLGRFSGSTQKFNNYFNTLEHYFEKNLLRSKRFHYAIDQKVPAEKFSLILFGGDCHLTPARCLVENVEGVNHVRLHPNDIINKVSGVNYEQLMIEPGDSSVTKPSLLGQNTLDPSQSWNSLLPIQYSVFICKPHDQLTGDVTFTDNLLNILLQQKTSKDHFLDFQKRQNNDNAGESG